MEISGRAPRAGGGRGYIDSPNASSVSAQRPQSSEGEQGLDIVDQLRS